MRKIIVKTLEIDISNTCGNVCQSCYHNKIINTILTPIDDFNKYLDNFFLTIDNKTIESIALYGGNLLEKESLNLYIDNVLRFDDKIDSYLFSTSFGNYNDISISNLKYIGERFKSKNLIFQFFYNYENELHYFSCLKYILDFKLFNTVFFAVQLIGIEDDYINNVIDSINKLFVNMGYIDDKFYVDLKEYFLKTIIYKIRTEDFYLTINGVKILIMIVFPVNKIGKTITSVVGNNCSFYNSTKFSEEKIEIGMLSIEYDGYVNFHNPNCISSMQRLFNILDNKTLIYNKLLIFLKFLYKNNDNNIEMLNKCNNCLNFNLKNRGVFEKK